MRKRILVTPLGLALIVAFAAFALVGASIARADSVGPINFESPYALGDIGGQQGWMKTGAFDFAVADRKSVV